MILWILIILAAVFILTLVFIFSLSISLEWTKKPGWKSEWCVSNLLAATGSDGTRLLCFRLKKKKAKKKHGEKAKQQKGETEIEAEQEKIGTDKKTEEKQKKKRKKGFDFDKLSKFWQYRRMTKNVLHAIYCFLKKILKPLKTDKKNEAHLKLSFEDPYLLGVSCAAIYPMLNSLAKLNWIHFYPDFTVQEDKAEYWGFFALKIRIGYIALAIVILIWKLPKRDLYRLYRQTKKKKKADKTVNNQIKNEKMP